MTSKPLYNALAAALYIILIVSLINIGSNIAPEEDNILMPMGMLSLLVLSVSVMAYIFFYQPVLMLLEGKRADAVQLFWKTIAIFAGFTVCVLIASFLFFA